MFNRQRCGEKCKSLIAHFNYSKIVMGGWFLISFFDMPAKNAKPFKQGGGEKGRGTHIKGAVRSSRV